MWWVIIKEGTWFDEQVVYVSDASLNYVPETNIELYVNQLEFKKKIK